MHRLITVIFWLGLLLCPVPSWAFGLVGSATHSDSASSTTCSPALTTGLANGDIVFLLLKRSATNTDPTGVPTGFVQLGKSAPGGAHFLYWKIAASESSWLVTWAAAERTGCTAVTYRSDFNVTSGADITFGNTAYTTTDTTARGVAITVPTANSPVIWFGNANNSTSQTIGAPSTGNPTGWTTDVSSVYDSGSRLYRTITSVVWSGSGTTGNMDGTISVSTFDKHVFTVALNPAAAGGAETFGFRLRLTQ